MNLFDTHAHLDDRKFDADREAAIQRAAAAGVSTLLTVGADLPSSRAAIALAERHPNVYAAVGIHPHDAKSVVQADLDELRRLAAHPRAVAVGEMGLDFYWDHSPHDVQQAILEAQLEIAGEVNKPIVVHLRDQKGQRAAYDDALALLYTWLSHLPTTGLLSRPTAQPPGVLHCFSGDLSTAQAALDLGFYLGVDGPVTYPNAHGLRATIAQVPLDRLLLETDCPSLPPQARRGQRNEPAFLTYIAEQVAQIKGLRPPEIARATTANAQRLFRIQPPDLPSNLPVKRADSR